jgi:hypothetical protein
MMRRARLGTQCGVGDIAVAQIAEIGFDLVEALKQHRSRAFADWSYSGDSERRAAHGLIQYPAMMVPSMQRDILRAVISIAPKAQTVLDPFVGSATALTETLATGKSFVGYDINPLAILIARVKSKPIHAELYAAAEVEVLNHLARDKRLDYEVRFPNQEKWFRRSNSIGLSRIRRAVERLASLHCRRFMWVALAETVRRCSNSRTSTYKLHVREKIELSGLDGAALSIFRAVMAENVKRMLAEKERLKKLCVLSQGKLTSGVVIELGDICRLPNSKKTSGVDIVLTSPPYGDNRTTVPYGQFSYLALRWIPHEDIDPSVNDEWLRTTHTLDTASLGGGYNKPAEKDFERLSEHSPSFLRMHTRLRRIDPDAARRWANYCRDLDSSVFNISATVRSGGYLVWTIGQRRIRSVNAPLVKVLSELHTANKIDPIFHLRRKIPSKRMPSHNAIGSLMQSEHVCFFRKS